MSVCLPVAFKAGWFVYSKIPKFSDARKLAVIYLKFKQRDQTLKDANGIANSEDPDQTAPLGAVWSGPALFAHTYLSENLGLLLYLVRNPEDRFSSNETNIHTSHIVRKPAFCICENKDADQLRGNREADQRLCFRYTDSTIPLLL